MERHEFPAFLEIALIDLQLSMMKGSSFSFFLTIGTFYHHSKTISLNLNSFKTIYFIL